MDAIPAQAVLGIKNMFLIIKRLLNLEGAALFFKALCKSRTVVRAARYLQKA